MKKLSDEAKPGQCLVCGKPLPHSSVGYCYYCVKMSTNQTQVEADRYEWKQAMEQPTGARHAKE